MDDGRSRLGSRGLLLEMYFQPLKISGACGRIKQRSRIKTRDQLVCVVAGSGIQNSPYITKFKRLFKKPLTKLLREFSA